MGLLTDFRGSIETANQILRDLIFRRVGCRTKITYFKHITRLIDL